MAFTHAWDCKRREWIIEEHLEELPHCVSRDVIGNNQSWHDLDCISSLSSCNDLPGLFLEEYQEEDLYLEETYENTVEDDYDDNNLGLDLDQEYETIPFRFKSIILAKSCNLASIAMGDDIPREYMVCSNLGEENLTLCLKKKRQSMERDYDNEDSEPLYKPKKIRRSFSFLRDRFQEVSFTS